MRGLVRFLLLLLVVVVVAWLGLWWYAEGRLELAVAQSTAALRESGWIVSHGAVSRGTSPLRAEVRVADLKLRPPSSDNSAPAMALPAVVLTVLPSAPLTLDIALPTAWQVAMAEGPSFTIHFATIHDRYQFDLKALLDHEPDPIRSGSFNATDMRVDSANTNFTLISIAGLSATGTRDPHAGKDGTAFSVHEKLSGLALSPIFTTLGNLPFDGKLSELSLDLTLSGPAIRMPKTIVTPLAPNGFAAEDAVSRAVWQAIGPAVHDWAKAGGHGTFGIGLKVGPLDAQDTGSFSFDDKIQPVMKSHLVADGVGAAFGAIATQYPGLVGGISKLTAATAPYMSKGAQGRQQLKLDLNLAKGALTANGDKVADVPPLVWPQAGAGAD